VSRRLVALIVEDDPHIAAILKELVESLGHEWIHATTLAEVRAAVAAGGFDYVLLDMQIPADATSHANVGCGETALRLIRRAFPARNARDQHVLQIIVVTGYSRDPDFVSKTHREGGDDFIAKPLGERIDRVLDKIRAALTAAGLDEHDGWQGPIEAPSPTAGPVETLRIAIDGAHLAQRNDVIVNGARGTLPEGHFVVLVSAISAHLRAQAEWHSAAKLGMTRNPWAPSRIQTELKELLPKGFRVVEANKPHRFRLNPAIAIERVDWAALGKHPLAEVRKIAAEWGKG
jgi:CheY-like chemotaxis protein